MNKENYRSNGSLPHPSNETQSCPYRPSIKVGYRVIPNVVDEKKTKKIIQPCNRVIEKNHCKKMKSDVQTQISGKFMGSQYIKDTEKCRTVFCRKGVVQCRDKFQRGDNVKQQMIQQFERSKPRRNSFGISLGSSRSKLPSYQNCGIKDIMEYKHALPYRQTMVTDKCTQAEVFTRFYKFSDLHEYDFRRRPEFLR